MKWQNFIEDALADAGHQNIDADVLFVAAEAAEALHESELRRLKRVEKTARDWADARVRDGHLSGHSVIPTAQRLLDALEDS